MDDYVSTFLTILLVVVAIFFAPLLILSNRLDDSMQTCVNSAASGFVDQVRGQGYVTSDDYVLLLDKLSTTGNTYEITVYTMAREYYHSTENGTEGYIAGYQPITQIEMQMTFTENDGAGRVFLNTGDYVFVEVKQTNRTLGQRLSSFFTGGSVPGIFARYGGRVGGKDSITRIVDIRLAYV